MVTITTSLPPGSAPTTFTSGLGTSLAVPQSMEQAKEVLKALKAINEFREKVDKLTSWEQPVSGIGASAKTVASSLRTLVELFPEKSALRNQREDTLKSLNSFAKEYSEFERAYPSYESAKKAQSAAGWLEWLNPWSAVNKRATAAENNLLREGKEAKDAWGKVTAPITNLVSIDTLKTTLGRLGELIEYVQKFENLIK